MALRSNGYMSRLFVSSNDRFIRARFLEQIDTSLACVNHLIATDCGDLQEIIAFERQGDAVERLIHEKMDASFILKLDKSDIETLAGELDNILDGMRKVANHVSIHAPNLGKLRPDALELLTIIKMMIQAARNLLAALEKGSLRLDYVNPMVDSIEALETEADTIRHAAEVGLAQEFADPKDVYKYLAFVELYRQLERVTDSANRCGSILLSLARKGV